jgi:formylglycine-generating enzyme required for sulfatase activity
MITSVKNKIELDLSLQPNCKKIELLKVKAGTFEMGYSPDSNLHLSDKSFKVTLSQDFWLGQYLVTQAQWQKIMGNQPSEFIGKNLPVENIDWHEARDFCQKLNILYKEILPKDYKLDLPTEAQWEYACKANTNAKNHGGDSLDNVLKIAWCSENSENHTHEVGLKNPNSWGFYDMFGNVFEWCFDMIVDYPKHPQIDWVGIDNHEYLGVKGIGSRIVRGGSCFAPADSDFFDAATRTYVGEDTKRGWYGFRLCLKPIRLVGD